MADFNTVGSIITEIQTLYNTKVNSEDIGVVISENKSVILDDFITSDEVELHAITREYPEMNEEEKSRLEKDIVISGRVYAPFLATVENKKLKIFDGRNRYNFLKKISKEYYDIDNASPNMAYQALKDTEVVIEIFITVDEKTKSYKSLDTEAIRLIADSYNLSRRHLTATQKAIIAFSERFEEQREYFREQSEEAQKTNTAGKKKTTKSERAVFDELLAKAVGGNKDYISKWKRVKDVIKSQSEEIYRKLSEIAYLYNGNFQEIVHLLNFKGKIDLDREVEDIDGTKTTLLVRLCRAYIRKKKENSNLPLGKNEKERKQAIDELKEENEILVPKNLKTKKVAEELQVKDLWVFINNSNLGKVTMERIVAAISYVLKTDNIDEDFKCYFAKTNDTSIRIDENKLTVENENLKEIVEIKSDEISDFVYEDRQEED